MIQIPWSLQCIKDVEEQINSDCGHTCFIFTEHLFFVQPASWKLTACVEIHAAFWKRQRVITKTKSFHRPFNTRLTKVYWHFHSEQEKLVQWASLLREDGWQCSWHDESSEMHGNIHIIEILASDERRENVSLPAHITLRFDPIFHVSLLVYVDEETKELTLSSVIIHLLWTSTDLSPLWRTTSTTTLGKKACPCQCYCINCSLLIWNGNLSESRLSGWDFKMEVNNKMSPY